LQNLLLIKKAKGFGFTLNEISELQCSIQSNGASCSFLRKKIVSKVEEIDQKIAKLQNMKEQILLRIQDASITCQGANEKTNCSELHKKTSIRNDSRSML